LDEFFNESDIINSGWQLARILELQQFDNSAYKRVLGDLWSTLMHSYNGNPRGRKSRGNKGKKSNRSLGSQVDSRIGVYGKAFSQMKRDLGWVMSVINVEEKYIDTLFNANAMTNAIGSQSLLNGCVTGNTSVTRNGQSTKAAKVIIDLVCRIGVTTPAMCRFLLILDKATNGATIGIASIFQAAVDGASDYTTSQRNVATVGTRVVFLYDIQFQLDTVQNTNRRIQMSIPLHFHTHYNTGNAGTVADISENSLYWCGMSSVGATQPTFTGSIRFLFVDN
jgi:hypothetical protein